MDPPSVALAMMAEEEAAMTKGSQSSNHIIDSEQKPHISRPRTFYLTNFGLAALIALASALLIAVKMGLPGRGLDPSWGYALADGFTRGLRFGHDITFTSGPLFFLWTRSYQPTTFWAIELFTGALILIWTASLMSIRHHLLTLTMLGASILVFPSIGTLDGIMYATMMLMFIVAIYNGRPTSFLVGCLFGVLFSIKFSFWIAALPLAVLLDIRMMLIRKDIPTSMVMFTVGSIGSFLLSGNRSSDIGEYIHRSLDIALGFGDAMQASGPWYFPALYVVVLGAWLLSAVFQVRHGPSNSDKIGRRLADRTRWLGVVWLGFIIWKAGFVRQDSHELTAFFCLPFFALAIRAKEFSPAGFLANAMVVATTLLAGVLGQMIALSNFPFWKEQPALSSAMNRLDAVAELLTPFRSDKRYNEAYRSATASIAKFAPDRLHGSVGAIPWDMAEIIAQGYDVRYQPVLQTYSAYTPYLQAITHKFFDEHGPDNLLLDLKAIDGQLPSLLFGESLESIIVNYDAVDDNELGLLTRRRSSPRSVNEGAAAPVTAMFGAWIDLSSFNSDYVRASIDTQTDLSGKIMKLIWTIEPPRLELKLEDDSVVNFRLVNAVARSGFVISPFLQDANDLVSSMTSGVAHAPKVKAIRVTAPPGWPMSYRSRVSMTLTPVTIEGNAQSPANPNILLKSEIAMSDVPANDIKPRWLDAETLFAHPPSDIQLTIPARMSLTGKTGLIEDAWVRGTTTGVDFSVKSDDGSILFDTKMRPKQEPADRSDRRFEVKNEGYEPLHVHLSTNGLGDLAWDWGYWRGLRFE